MKISVANFTTNQLKMVRVKVEYRVRRQQYKNLIKTQQR